MQFPEPPDVRQCEREPLFSTRVEDQPLWMELCESLRDRLFPLKLPALELTSTPVPVPDRLAGNTNPWALGTATIVNVGIVGIAILLGFRVVAHQPPPTTGSLDKFVIKDVPLFAPLRANDRSSGGGTNDSLEANKGHNPNQDMHTLAPVQLPVLEDPKLAVDNSIAVPPEVKLPDNPTMAVIGVHSSANVTLVSGGPGGPAGIGSGDGRGDGPGHGQNGWGSGPNEGIYWPGRDGVTQPVPIYTPEAEFSDEARKQKHQGACIVSVIIDAQGNPQDPHVVRQLGYGLDQKALQAIMRYRFQPAKKRGKPVPVRISIVVDFKLY